MRIATVALGSVLLTLGAWAQHVGPGGGQTPPQDPVELLLHILRMADADENGEVTFEELQALKPDLTQEQFDRLDRNGDGVISAADLPEPPPMDPIERLLRLLHAADANGDGAVTLEEIQAIEPGFPPELFDALDRNGDGVLSEADLPAPPPPGDLALFLRYLLENADADGDGAVTLEEAQAFRPGLTEDAFDHIDRNDDGVLTIEDMPPAPPYNPIERLLRLLREADANDDGQVTFEEVQALIPDFPREAFDRLDFNDDGVLSRADLPPAPPCDRVERLRRLIHEADADGDGQVTLEEVQAIIPEFTQEAFDHLDRNDDGVLSREDLPQEPPLSPCECLRRLLREADADGSGDVTLAELSVIVPEITQEQFDHLDRNGDGVISPVDFPPFPCSPCERLIRLLRHADSNGDGHVTFEELAEVIPGLTQEQFDHLDQNGDGVLTPGDCGEPPLDPIARLIRLLRDADVDGNGEVTFEELQAVASFLTQEMFDRLDRNDDGVISRDDLPEPPEHPRDRFLRLLREADADGNHEVTFEELAAVIDGLTQELFDHLDRNDDGVLTIEDAPEGPVPPEDGQRRLFLHALIEADMNYDGVLDLDEIEAAFPDGAAELLAALDANGDFVITRDEIRAALAHSFNGGELVPPHDVNADGATNSMDVQNTILHALDLFNNILPADITGDGAVTSVDVQGVILGALE